MVKRCVALSAALVLGAATSAVAQTAADPGLATLIERVFGSNGLVVDSEARLPDGSTHSGHFNSGFQSDFRQFNVALAGQLTSLPLPSPASGLTYHFDESTGTFVRSTQSFGPILADRAETIGKGKVSFGYNYQYFSFDALEGTDLKRVPAVFTHDDFQLGGGRSDVVVTTNAIDASVSQFTGVLTFGVTDRVDISAAIPTIRTQLAIRSTAEIHRVGTAGNTLVHFFRQEDTSVGDRSEFGASGSAAGLGDIVVRLKGTAIRGGRSGLAVGLDARLPTGDERELLGAGAAGLKPFAALSLTAGRLSPHVNVGYQWNGDSILAGDVDSGIKGDLADRFLLGVGADMGVATRLSVAVDVLAERVERSGRLAARSFTATGLAGTFVFDDLGFYESAFWTANGATGIKVKIAADLLANLNVRFRIGNNGLTTRIAPLLGFEYGF
jgi:hypothetical protein